MSQPVKLSDALVLDARIAAEVQERSIAGQVEFWAKLGRSMVNLLDGRQVKALQRNAAATTLSSALSSVDTPEGRRRVAEVVASRPFPHFEQHPTRKDLLVRTDQGGGQTVGRFVNRVFIAEGTGKRLPPKQNAGSAATDEIPVQRTRKAPAKRKNKSLAACS
jgi:hypothetical protein